MVVNSKIRDSDWLTFTLTIVNFNYVFIQPPLYNTWDLSEEDVPGRILEKVQRACKTSIESQKRKAERPTRPPGIWC